MTVEPLQLRESPSGASLALGVLTSFPNLLWVNLLAPGPGTGSVIDPFPTPAAALAAVPAGGTATLVLAPADYSLTPALVIVDRNINVICLGGAETGGAGAPARALLPNVTFGVSAAPLTFFAECCVLPLVTVLDVVTATLRDCTSVWADAGSLATVYATGGSGQFVQPSQQSINGTIGVANLTGMLTQSLICLSVMLTRCQIILGGTGVAADFVVIYELDNDPGAVSIVANTALFCDQITLFQILENAINLGGAPPVNVQETSALQFWWGANGYVAGEFFPPYVHFAPSNPASTVEWIPAPRKGFGKNISAQRSTAPAANQTYVMHKGATVAGVAATALVVTIPAGQLFASVELAIPVIIDQGDFMVMKPSQTDPAGIVEVRVTVL